MGNERHRGEAKGMGRPECSDLPGRHHVVSFSGYPMAMAQTVNVLPNVLVFAAVPVLVLATFPLDFIFMATLGSFWSPIVTYDEELIHIILSCADCFILGYLLAYVWHRAHGSNEHLTAA